MSVAEAMLNEYTNQIDKGIELTYEEFEKQYCDEWMQGLNLAYRYYIFHNSLEVPLDYIIDGYPLGHWIESQRKFRKSLTANQFKLLDDLNMKWSTEWNYHRKRTKQEIKYGDEQYAKWIEHLLQAKAFFEEHGHLDVPVGYKIISENGKSFNLYTWICSQRHNYKINRIPSDRMSKLDTYFMIYDFTHKDEIKRLLGVKDHYFLPEKYRGINPFVEEELPEIFGENSLDDLNGIPVNFESIISDLEDELNFPSEITCSMEKHNFKDQRLSQEARWNGKYKCAKDFYATHGHLLIPRSEVVVLEDGTKVKIGQWINNQRTIYKSGKMPAKRQEALEAINMIWSPRLKENSPLQPETNDTLTMESLESRLDNLSSNSLKALEDSIATFYRQLTELDETSQISFELFIGGDSLPSTAKTNVYAQRRS